MRAASSTRKSRLWMPSCGRKPETARFGSLRNCRRRWPNPAAVRRYERSGGMRAVGRSPPGYGRSSLPNIHALTRLTAGDLSPLSISCRQSTTVARVRPMDPLTVSSRFPEPSRGWIRFVGAQLDNCLGQLGLHLLQFLYRIEVIEVEGRVLLRGMESTGTDDPLDLSPKICHVRIVPSEFPESTEVNVHSIALDIVDFHRWAASPSFGMIWRTWAPAQLPPFPPVAGLLHRDGPERQIHQVNQDFLHDESRSGDRICYSVP
jgi:hypothetical protein